MIKKLNSSIKDPNVFSIAQEAFGKFTAYQLKNVNSGESATIIPDAGGILNSLVLSKNGKKHELIDGSLTEQDLTSSGKAMYKSSLLFPFPNRIKNGLYSFEGKMYQLEPNDKENAIHGLFSDVAFTVTKQEVKKAKVGLELKYSTDGKHPAYPFAITLTLLYELNKKGLNIWAEVTNNGSKNAPFGLGWHPYFKTGSNIDELELWLPSHNLLPTNEQSIPLGKFSEDFMFNSFEALGPLELDNGYKLKGEAKQKLIKINDKIKDFEIEINLQRGYDYFQIYTPPSRNSIAIEPQTCAADAFNNKLGLLVLKPGEKQLFNFAISIN